MRKSLRIFAIEELEKNGFVENPSNFMYQYRGTIPDVGVVEVSCKMSLLGRNSLNIFICFKNPVEARKKGFKCNIHSGKYNFYQETTQRDIKRVIKHLFE